MKAILLISIALVITIKIDAQDKALITDSRDGKVYKTVKIGDQIWLAENLAYKAGSGCWVYSEEQSNVELFGYLYDWAAATNVCPSGWHLPTDEEWIVLTKYAGIDEGTKLKSASGWKNNGNGTDEFGFAALPGGYRDSHGKYLFLGGSGRWWSATEGGMGGAWYRYATFGYNSLDRLTLNKKNGFSVRCVKDKN
jgi:uncharacterized protein (TIGR02145 family)